MTFLHLLDKYYPEILILEEICISCTNGGGTLIFVCIIEGRRLFIRMTLVECLQPSQFTDDKRTS